MWDWTWHAPVKDSETGCDLLLTLAQPGASCWTVLLSTKPVQAAWWGPCSQVADGVFLLTMYGKRCEERPPHNFRGGSLEDFRWACGQPGVGCHAPCWPLVT